PGRTIRRPPPTRTPQRDSPIGGAHNRLLGPTARSRLSATITIHDFAPTDQAAARRLVLAGLGDHSGLTPETITPPPDPTPAPPPGHRSVSPRPAGPSVGRGAVTGRPPAPGAPARMSAARRPRGQGIGRALVNHLLAAARARGYRRLVVETNDDWWHAIGL